MTSLRAIFSCIAMFFLSGCTQAMFGIANAPSHFNSLNVSRDVVFDNAHQLALDIYAPKNAAQSPLPVIVFFHGGRWQTGHKGQYRFAGDALAHEGFVAVVPDYRKYPAVKFPAFVDDAAAAVAWTYRNIARFGGNPQRIYIAGHSSGAHLASLVATDVRYLERQGLPRSIVRGFAGLAGPYNFTPQEDDLKDMFGPPEHYPAMRATTYIDGRQPPMLLLHGQNDDLVGLFNLQDLEARIRATGGRVESIVYKDVDHQWIVGALSWAGKKRAPVAADIRRFFNSIP